MSSESLIIKILAKNINNHENPNRIILFIMILHMEIKTLSQKVAPITWVILQRKTLILETILLKIKMLAVIRPILWILTLQLPKDLAIYVQLKILIMA